MVTLPVTLRGAFHRIRRGTKRGEGHSRSGGACRGVTLVEVLIVISVASAVMGVAITLLHLLLRSERNHSRAIHTTVTLSRLTEVFRTDAHAATKITVTPAGKSGAELKLADASGGDVVYTANEHVLNRVETAQAAVAHRDGFHFPPGSEIRFERDERLSLARIVIELAPRQPQAMPGTPGRAARGQAFTIEAAVDRDRRFARRLP
jgi:prepilin-type N-terminal cleavage/methylation domain-containing protein